MGINVLSLFDGMSCGQIALERAGIKVNNYFASEIDKYAIKVTQVNYPNTVQLGNVLDIKASNLPKINLLIGGSPCQGFSFAGKQLNFNDSRSKLFFEFVRILNEVRVVNPNIKFFLENVRMKKEYQDIITGYLGVPPIEINSNLVSAQNRKRLYWTNIPDISQPEDKGIMLRDIVHEHADNHLSEKEIGYMLRGNNKWQQAGACRLERYLQYENKKAFTVTANIHKGVPYNCFFDILNEYVVPFDKTLQILEKEVQQGKVGYFRKDSQANRVYYIHNKAITLCGDSGGGAAKMGQYLFGCITPDRIDKRQNGQRFNEGRKFYTLTAQDKHGVLVEGYIRKLTPIECERLQTVPDNYTSAVSNSQRYKMLGNGWTVDIIVHNFEHIIEFI